MTQTAINCYPRRLSRLRRPGGRYRGTRAAGRGPRRPQLPGAAQPRPAGVQRDGAGCVPRDPPVRGGLRGAGRCDGVPARACGCRRTTSCSAASNAASVPRPSARRPRCTGRRCCGCWIAGIQPGGIEPKNPSLPNCEIEARGVERTAGNLTSRGAPANADRPDQVNPVAFALRGEKLPTASGLLIAEPDETLEDAEKSDETPVHSPRAADLSVIEGVPIGTRCDRNISAHARHE